ncbi:MAG TPA: peptide ABC transporter substrate-binding protein [Thermotogota bacterium]|nr:peptide ABC transporter substrate-binding protein [Thermotogota bacterium]HNR62552.1 peptide ABC transporter substrate-binding protein [Thermotogota bacterium]HNT94558.1 peptide ABC transporter substrate-binding protein [Thermotogota bacterium]HOZ11103.1 peptide ABC transporter substrate-binding protein [Thermotogota bacterium]HPB86041.1 peptide ABC transporter substrate-binding protein [Thermotogota bacterium]
MKKVSLLLMLTVMLLTLSFGQAALEEAGPAILKAGILKIVDESVLTANEFKEAVQKAFPGKEGYVTAGVATVSRTEFITTMIKILGLSEEASQYAEVVTMANDEDQVASFAAGAFTVAFRSNRQLLNYRYGHLLDPWSAITKEEAALSFYMALNPPKVGGTLTTAVGADAPGFNTLFTSSGLTWTVCNIIADGYIGSNQDGFYTPRMIKRIPTLDNGLLVVHDDDSMSITYELRKGMKWHDGAPVTARDAKFQWEVMTSGAPVTSNSFETSVDAVDIIDDHTFTIHLKEKSGSGYFGSSVYAYYFGWFQIPEHLFRKDFEEAKKNDRWEEFVQKVTRTPVMTGPYKFKEYKEGQYIVLEAFDEYFMGRPNIDTLVMKIIPDADVTYAAVKNGELDFGRYTLSMKQSLQLEKEHGDLFSVYYVKNVAPDLIFLNFRDPDDLSKPNFFFGDVRVRQALMHAINRDAINNLIYSGKGEICHTWLTPLHIMREALDDPSVKKYAYDVKKAKDLLAEAGWKAGRGGILEKDGKAFKFPLLLGAGSSDYLTMAQMIQGMLKQVGIEMEIDTKPGLTIWELQPQGKYHANLSGWGYGISDEAVYYWTEDMIPSEANGFGGTNYIGWVNEESDAYAYKAFAELDQTKKVEYYAKHLALWANDLPYLPLVAAPTPIFAKKYVKAFDAGYDNGLGWIIQNWYIDR